MDLELSPAHLALQARARAVAEAELRPRAAEHDRLARFPEAQVRALAQAGFLQMLAPTSAGGAGLGSVAYSLVISEIAKACPSTAVTMAVTNMVGDAIAAFGNQAQQDQHIPKLADATYWAGSFALSEPGAGSDAASLKATAIKKGDRYVLNGNKCWITSGDRAGVVLVMAKTDPAAGAKGISAFLVDPRSSGFSFGRHEEKLGLRASSTVTLVLEDVEVPEANRLGPEGIGFKIAMRALDGGRIGIGSQASGIGYGAVEAAIAYAAARPELSGSQSIQWKLADATTALDAARLLVLRAATKKDLGLPFGREASMAKLFATESANQAALAAMAVLGMDGLDDQHPVERALRDVRVTTIYEGTSEIQRLVIARGVLASA